MRIALTSLSVAAILTLSTAMNADAHDPTLPGRVAKLEQQMKAVRADVAGINDKIRTLAQGVMNNTNSINSNIESIAGNTDNIRSNGDRIQSNLDRVVAHDKFVKDSNQRFQGRLDDISRYDSESGRYVPSLAALGVSPLFGRKFIDATMGRLWIYNPNRWEQHLYINGVRWRVRPTLWSYASVAPGPVTVQKYVNGSRLVLTDWYCQADGNGYAVLYNLQDHRSIGVPDRRGISPPVPLRRIARRK